MNSERFLSFIDYIPFLLFLGCEWISHRIGPAGRCSPRRAYERKPPLTSSHCQRATAKIEVGLNKRKPSLDEDRINRKSESHSQNHFIVERVNLNREGPHCLYRRLISSFLCWFFSFCDNLHDLLCNFLSSLSSLFSTLSFLVLSLCQPCAHTFRIQVICRPKPVGTLPLSSSSMLLPRLCRLSAGNHGTENGIHV